MIVCGPVESVWHDCASALLLVALLCIMIVEVDPECDLL